MIREKLRQFFIPVLMVLFVFSCVGTSLGMMLHNTVFVSVETAQESHQEAAKHACCTVSQDEHESTPMNMAHMDEDTAAMVGFLTIVLAALMFLVKWEHEQYLYTVFRQYIRRWISECQYYSLYILRLFSRGILHSKAW